MSFALALVLCVLVTGIISLLDLLWFEKKRKQREDWKQPKWIEYSRSFFPVLLLVLLIRSFLIEPFRIPSGSLEPTLLTGDFIAVNKFAYGLRLPVTDSKFISVSEPKVADIVVFSWPPAPKFDYIKRVIGLPGDKISYHNKKLTINGVRAKQHFITYTTYVTERGEKIKVEKIEEDLMGVKHGIYIRPDVPPFNFDITVPTGHYFMMGDNRDNSSDSRYWGYLPEANIRGKAFMVWMSWNYMAGNVRWSRIGTMIH